MGLGMALDGLLATQPKHSTGLLVTKHCSMNLLLVLWKIYILINIASLQRESLWCGEHLSW